MHLFHFLMGLVWLVVIAAALSLYLFFPYCVWLLFRWCRAERRERGKFWNLRMPADFLQGLRKSLGRADEDEEWPPPLLRPADWKRFPALALLSLCLCLAAYAHQRRYWLGPGSAHPAAKEYFIAGQVLNLFRHFETARRHPEAPDLRLLARLQRVIYRQGAQLLPADDGERGVWQVVWFDSHYYKNNRRQLGLKLWESSPEMRALLDQWWDSLVILGTRPIADKRMLEEHALRDYPALAFLYLQNDGFYTHKLIGSAQRLAMMPEHVERYRRLSDWLWNLPKRWDEIPDFKAFTRTHPKVLALLQTDVLLTLKMLIQGEIHERKFDCANASVKRYIIMRQIFVHPTAGAYTQMQEKDQAQRLYDIAIDTWGARSTKYIISEYCDVEVAGKEDNNKPEITGLAQVRNRTIDEEARNAARVNYLQEDEILKEKYYGD